MIVVKLAGGMGNQMFQYAFGRYLSLQHGTELLLDTSILLNRVPCGPKTFYDYELSMFDLPSRIAGEDDIPLYPMSRSIRSRTRRAVHVLQLRARGFKYVLEREFGFSAKLLRLPDNIYLDGYWQSDMYFSGVGGQIRADFTYSRALSDKAKGMQEAIRRQPSVCVHIRRGDYLQYVDHFGVVGADYVTGALAWLKERRPELHCFVFSNDIPWCQRALDVPRPCTFVSQENAGTDDREHFHLMSLCRDFVISNSTFSWWAAWLSGHPDKVVIAPKNWFQNRKIDTSAVVPREWVRM
jgi:hypothetical protein